MDSIGSRNEHQAVSQTDGSNLAQTLTNAFGPSQDAGGGSVCQCGAADGQACSGSADANRVCSCSLEEKHHCCAPSENQPSNVLADLKQAHVVAKGCKNRYCPECCTSLGVKLREKVREQISDWKSVLLVTLTVDPTLFAGPQEAYERVRERRGISRLVRSLLKTGHITTGRYFVAVEFQANAMPHWHLLLESSFVPVERVQELWDLNRPDGAGPVERNRPGFGFVWMSKSDFKSMDHAANYVTKYCLKHPEQGYPDWVLDFEGRVPKYSTSRGFFADDDEPGEVVETTAEVCFCSRCRGEQPGNGVWKQVALPPEDWQAMGLKGAQAHRVKMLEDGRELREVWFPIEGTERQNAPREKTIRHRVQKCGESGTILLERTKILAPLKEGEPVRVFKKWYWLGYLTIPFAEYAEVQDYEARRYPVELDEAERLGGRSWLGPRNSFRRDANEHVERAADHAETEDAA